MLDSESSNHPPPQPSPDRRAFTPVFDGLWREGADPVRCTQMRKCRSRFRGEATEPSAAAIHFRRIRLERMARTLLARMRPD